MAKAQGEQKKKKKQQVSKKDQKLISRIVQSFTDRSRKDIKVWREALKAAENPKMPQRKSLQDLYKELELDLHFISQRQIRVLSVLSQQFHVVNATDGEKEEELTTLLESGWFYDVLEAWLYVRFKGTSLVEFDFEEEKIKLHEISRKHLIPEKKLVTERAGGTSGIDYSDPVYENSVLQLGKDDELGLLNPLAPAIIWKRNAQQAWAEFGDKFGIPYRSATTNSRDQGRIDQIEQMLEDMGGAAYGVFPEGTVLDFKEANTSDAFNVFDKQIERCNSEISKPICGGTMLSDNGSSRSQSETQLTVFEKIVSADKKSLLFFINDELLPLLTANGYSFDGYKFEWDDRRELPLLEQWTIAKDLLQTHDIPDEELTKKFGFTVTKKKTGEPVNFNEKQNTPNDASLDFGLMTDLYGSACCGEMPITNSTNILIDDWLKSFRSLFKAVYDKKGTEVIPINQYFSYTKTLLQGLKTGFKDRLKGISYDSPDHKRLLMLQANIYRFSAAATWQQARELNQLAKTAKNFTEFKKQATLRENVVLAHLKTEYQHTIASSQNAANWLRASENANEVDLMYQTVGDSRVRPEHKQYDGIVAPVDDKIWDKIYPPNGWRDRCEVIEITKGSKKRSDTSKVTTDGVSKGFDHNVGKTEHIFQNSHNYFNEFPDAKKLNRKTFGLPTASKIFKEDWSNYPKVITQDQKTYEKWWDEELKQSGKDKVYYADLFGHSHQVNKGFKIQNREGVAQYVEQVLQNPDEVWLINNKQGYNTHYFKRFKNKMLVALTTTKNENLEVVTWHEINEKAFEELTKGLPIYIKNGK